MPNPPVRPSRLRLSVRPTSAVSNTYQPQTKPLNQSAGLFPHARTLEPGIGDRAGMSRAARVEDGCGSGDWRRVLEMGVRYRVGGIYSNSVSELVGM
jgi:hypothetical protein